MVDVVISSSVPRCGRLARLLASRAERMLRAMRLQKVELSILLCDDPTIQQLNAQYRGMNKPTDVLAFAQSEGLPMGVAEPLVTVLGDIVLSVPTAQRQASARGLSLHDEATMLLAHGLLHLLGFDHHTHHHDRRMRARVDLLLATV
jgi:probable rRNA maturation factor